MLKLFPMTHMSILFFLSRLRCEGLFVGFFAVILTIVNVYSVRLSAALLTWLSFFKILVIAFVIILGTWKLSQQGEWYIFLQTY